MFIAVGELICGEVALKGGYCGDLWVGCFE